MPMVYLGILLIMCQPWFVSSSAQNRNRINGRVATVNDKPIENVRVTLLSDRLIQVGVEYTDSSGRYNFENLPRGYYSVLVEPSGADYERQSAQVEVNPHMATSQGGSESFRVDFVLRLEIKKAGPATSSDRVVFYQKVPDAAKKEYRRGLDAFKKGDFETGFRLLERAIEIFPDYYDALEQLGTERVKSRQYESALPLLKRAVEVNRNDWRSFYSLGVALTELKQATEAVKPLRRAVELNSGWAYTHLRLGIALGQSEATHAEAIKTLKEAARIGGNNIPDTFLHLASLYNKLKQYSDAVAALESYLRAAAKTNERAEEREYYETMLEQLRHKAAAQKNN